MFFCRAITEIWQPSRSIVKQLKLIRGIFYSYRENFRHKSYCPEGLPKFVKNCLILMRYVNYIGLNFSAKYRACLMLIG
ncbi:hypothetical protein RV134_190167 [Roseovarius sp. EC-HK134]|nr:hypothetical protein RV134_190167 [Roseovarius sp. EC-HK134]VVS98807.1 hypothetical protein RV420_220017 [Roseovarius sp. EC-SD190]